MANLKYYNNQTSQWEEIKVSTRFKELLNTKKLTADQNYVNIEITNFNPNEDVLFTILNSTWLQKGEDYIINGGLLRIETMDGSNWSSGDTFNFVVLKNVDKDDLPSADGSLIQNGSITIAKLASSLQDYINKIGTAELATVADNLSGAVNELNSQMSEMTNNLNNYVLTHKLNYKTVSTTTGFGSSGTSKPATSSWTHIKTQGADATLVVMVGITSATDSNPTMIDDSIFSGALSDATSAGVKIDMVKLHLGTGYSDGFDRGSYLPSDVPTYFNNWKNICLHYAQLCINNNIPILCIGCEQPNQSVDSNLSYWTTIVNAIKASYPSLLLTYAPKTWEFCDSGHQKIWSILDIIGANVYLTYTQQALSQAVPILDDLCQSFYYNFDGKKVIDNINNLSQTYNKQVFITEIGCMPIDKGLICVKPYDYSTELNTPNYDAVMWLMEASFNSLFRNRNVCGFAWWHTDNPFMYFSDNEVTSAEQVMIDYIKGGLI